jgi:hypothetical protein
MVDSPKQLTVTMFFIIVLQSCELQIPFPLVRFVGEIKLETNFVEHRFSFRIHYALSEACPLIVHPSTQLWGFLVLPWHIAYNALRKKVGVLVVIFKTKIKRSISHNNSQ